MRIEGAMRMSMVCADETAIGIKTAMQVLRGMWAMLVRTAMRIQASVQVG